MSEQSAESITAFLRAFERTDTRGDVAALASCYAETFLVAGPDGAVPIRREDFALALPRRKKMFDEMGCRSTRLGSAVVTRLDGRYAMAETTWLMEFAHSEGQISEVEVGSTFVLDTKDDLKIIFYLTHQDIGTVLQERGILSEPAPGARPQR
jgi:ketosteroid isomerase-like protein